MARDHASCEQPGGGFSRFGTYAGQCSPSRSVGLAKMVHARSSKLSIEMGDSDKMRSPAWSRLRAKKPRPAAEEVSTSSASFATDDENEADDEDMEGECQQHSDWHYEELSEEIVEYLIEASELNSATFLI